MICVVIITAAPVIKVWVVLFLLRLCAALSEPLCDQANVLNAARCVGVGRDNFFGNAHGCDAVFDFNRNYARFNRTWTGGIILQAYIISVARRGCYGCTCGYSYTKGLAKVYSTF